MKQTITAIFLLISLAGLSQKDSTAKKDTVYKPVYESADTIKKAMIYADATNTVKFMEGYIIVKGFKTEQKGKMVWVSEPKPTAVLDEKKRPLKTRWLQLL
jgi:hypothetical protein